MEMINKLRYLNSKLIRRKKELNTDEQKKYLGSFPEPKNNLERSFFQYKCQMKANGILYRVMSNIASFFLFVLKILSIYVHKHEKKNMSTNYLNDEAVFFKEALDCSYLPYELTNKYNKIYCANYLDAHFLDKNDIKFIMKLLKLNPFSFFWVYKSLIKISSYHGQIINRKPKAIITSSEYSFTSSLLTDYCEMMGVQHINIQHGEKIFEIVDAFCSFHTFYVWDNWYAKVVKSLRANGSQFVVAGVPLIDEMCSEVKSINIEYKKVYDMKYYLGGEGDEDLKNLSIMLSQLIERGYSIKVRPHPRYTNLKLLKTYFSQELIEDYVDISLVESFATTCAIISFKSAVLFQAFKCGKITYIDDVTNKDAYMELQQQEYIMIEKSEKISSIF